jgi:hypothetical protein
MHAQAWEDAGRHESPRKLAPEGDMGRDGDGDSHGAWEILTPLFRLCSGRAPRIQLASTRSTLRLRGGSASAGLGGAPLLVTNPTFCPTLLLSSRSRSTSPFLPSTCPPCRACTSDCALLSLVLTCYALREHVLCLLSLVISCVSVPVSAATIKHVPTLCTPLLVSKAMPNQNAT